MLSVGLVDTAVLADDYRNAVVDILCLELCELGFEEFLCAPLSEGLFSKTGICADLLSLFAPDVSLDAFLTAVIPRIVAVN